MHDETYILLEEAAQVQLRKVATLDTDGKEGKEALTKSIQLVELLNSTDKNSYDYQDKEEKRRIEEERNNATNQIERDKQKITWGRVGLEMAKLVVPLAMQILAFASLQQRMFKFEETGRISSTGGREMHLPKFWWK